MSISPVPEWWITRATFNGWQAILPIFCSMREMLKMKNKPKKYLPFDVLCPQLTLYESDFRQERAERKRLQKKLHEREPIVKLVPRGWRPLLGNWQRWKDNLVKSCIVRWFIYLFKCTHLWRILSFWGKFQITLHWPSSSSLQHMAAGSIIFWRCSYVIDAVLPVG